MRCKYCRVPIGNEAICSMCGAPNENAGHQAKIEKMMAGMSFDPMAGGEPPLQLVMSSTGTSKTEEEWAELYGK